jgi:EmrB/QacA subfamily drug resistance transporter
MVAMPPIVPLVLGVALFMEQMDSTVIATAMPAIAADLGTDPLTLKLAITGYFVALATFVPISGWISDRLGARNVFRAAIAIFVIGSAASALSDSLAMLVAARFIQGIGASMMTPVARLLLLRITPRSEMVGTMAWLTVPALAGPMFGPPVAGFLTTHFGWPWIFWLNVPLGLLGIIMSSRVLPKVATLYVRPLDLTGFTLTTIAISGIVFGLSAIGIPAIPALAPPIALVIGLISAVLYVLHSRRSKHPLLQLDLLRLPLLRRSLVGASLFRFGVGAVPFLLPLMLQLCFGFDALEAGLITFAAALGGLMSKSAIAWLLKMFGFRNTILFGVIGSALSTLANAFFDAGTAIPIVFVAIFIGGIARSVFFTSINTLSYADTDDERMGHATSISAILQHVTIAVGVAIGAALVDNFSAGATPLLADFHLTFVTLAAISLVAAIPFLRLQRSAGSDLMR